MAPRSQSLQSADAPQNSTTAPTKATQNPPPLPPPPQSFNNATTTPHSGTNGIVTMTSQQDTLSAPTSVAKDTAADSASPYGTRSRNRGQVRPNYAEDKDIDSDIYDPIAEKKEAAHRKGSRQSTAAAGIPQDAQKTNGTNNKKRASPDEGKHGGPQNIAKEPAPSSHTDPANPPNPPQPSKKRKVGNPSSAASTGVQSHLAAQYLAANDGVLRNVQRGYAETNMLSFDNYGARPKDGRLVADDGTVLEKNDCVYLVCEPPGEPYYLGRIMEFLHAQNDPIKPIDALRINWFYRPKDIGRNANDTRTLFATMHSDISPLTSLRGKCQIKHKAEIDDFDEFRKTPDCFYYDKLYDRYIQKNYEIIPTSQIVNVPEKVKKVLDERWRFVLVEQGRGKELTSEVKSCKRCKGYCASNDSVDCAVCKQTYHMNCVRPPLLKKPSRGFAWSCGPCSRAQERKLEARNTPNFSHDSTVDPDDDDYLDDEDDEVGNEGATSGTSLGDAIDDSHHAGTTEQIYQASLWPYRYLGIHCKPEDALDYDDRIYPRASSRLGPKHQANVLPWPGKPVQYVKPLEIKKNGRRDGRLSKEAQAALEREKKARENRPKWIQDEPPGYVRRGEDPDEEDPDSTCTLIWKPPKDVGRELADVEIDQYMESAKEITRRKFGVDRPTTNMLDVARDALFNSGFDPEIALARLPEVDKSEYKEPELTPAEKKKFEEGVMKYGSELHFVMKHVKTLSPGTIVRYYYVWKKTKEGRQIWGNFSGRRSKKEAKKAEAAASKLQDDVADDFDDSAFDTGKASQKKKSFICKFCSTKTSRQWRRAPNAGSHTEVGGKGKDKNAQYIQALCRRCAELWRRYAIQWEDIEEVAKKVAQAGGRAWKKKVDEELLKELIAANEMMNRTEYSKPAADAASPNAAPTSTGCTAPEPPRKKLKGHPSKDTEPAIPQEVAIIPAPPQGKRKEKAPVEKPMPSLPPPAQEIPKPKILPCAVCHQRDPMGDQHLSCRECRLTVHRNCYGVIDNRNPGKWICDMCTNDKSPQVSIRYSCVLCPIDFTFHDFVEPPKISHKKKTERERERERVERENAVKAAEFYKKKQVEMNRPVNPREPLKRTENNNWVHVTCAVWTPEIKFAKAKALETCEGVGAIPRARFGEVCKICEKTEGACVQCHTCRAPVHVECANQADYLLGFDITPVKGSRRDQFNIVTINGESGTMTAAIWCKEHAPTKTIVHRIHDVVNESGMNALQLYVQNFKQADLTLTGTARKAQMATLATKMLASPSSHPVNRRASATTMSYTASSNQRPDTDERHSAPESEDKICITCGIDVSPKWHSLDHNDAELALNEADLGEEAMKFMAQRNYQCHKCNKANRRPSPLPRRESPTPVEPPMSLSTSRATVPILTSPPPANPVPEQRLPSIPPAYPSWTSPRAQSQSLPALSTPHASGPTPPPSMPPIQAPVQHPTQVPPPLQAPIQPPRPSPIASHPPPTHTSAPAPSPRQSTSYSDWHRTTTTQQPQPSLVRQLNGSHSPVTAVPVQPLLQPNHLRPPPVPKIPPPPQPHNGHLGNGMPPSPRHINPPPSLQNPPYMHPVHHGGFPSQRSPFSATQASPTLSRENGPNGQDLGPADGQVNGGRNRRRRESNHTPILGPSAGMTSYTEPSPRPHTSDTMQGLTSPGVTPNQRLSSLVPPGTRHRPPGDARSNPSVHNLLGDY